MAWSGLINYVCYFVFFFFLSYSLRHIFSVGGGSLTLNPAAVPPPHPILHVMVWLTWTYLLPILPNIILFLWRYKRQYLIFCDPRTVSLNWQVWFWEDPKKATAWISSLFRTMRNKMGPQTFKTSPYTSTNWVKVTLLKHIWMKMKINQQETPKIIKLILERN